jgi:hypothetical protein
VIKRITWFVAGAAAGASGSLYARRKVQRTAAKLAPVNVAKAGAESVRRKGRAVVEAVREGRSAMAAKEAEMKAIRDGHPRGGRPDAPAGVERLDDWRLRTAGRLRTRP